METLYIALILICLFVIFCPQVRGEMRAVINKIYNRPPTAPTRPKVTNSGMMNLSYGLAEEQARLYNNIPIPSTGQPHGYSLGKTL
jgi:hypothetical protein